MEADREFLAEFIKLYRSLPSLWKLKSKEYFDRIQKNTDYQILVNKLKEKDPNATKDTATKKINNLRVAYRREMKKRRESLKLGAGKEYVPTLWYYELLNFLDENPEFMGGTSEENTEDLPMRPAKRKVSNEDKLIEIACEKLSRKIEPTAGETLASSWALQYNEMETSQKIIARKIFADVLFQGAMGKLTVESALEIQNIFHNQNDITSSSMPMNHLNPVPKNLFAAQHSNACSNHDSPRSIKIPVSMDSNSSMGSSRDSISQLGCENTTVKDEVIDSNETSPNFFLNFDDT